MDVTERARSNGSEYEDSGYSGYSDYSDYYSDLDALLDFRPCEKHQVKRFGRSFLPVFYSVSCALGLLANLTLLHVLVRSGVSRRLQCACLLVSDLLFTCTLPFWAQYAARDWVFGARACQLVTAGYAVGLYSSNLHVTCAVLRGCLDATRGFRCSPRVGETTRSAVWCACVVLLSCLAAATHLSFVGEHHTHGETYCSYHLSPDWKIFMRLQMILLLFGVPFPLLLGSSVVLFLRSRSTGRSGALRRALVTTGLFFVLWFPYTLVLILHLLQELHVVTECDTSLHLDLAIQITECIAFTHVFFNPVAYLLLNRQAWRTLTAKCASPREYLLESMDSESGQDSGVELGALQGRSDPEDQRETAEKQDHVLPGAT